MGWPDGYPMALPQRDEAVTIRLTPERGRGLPGYDRTPLRSAHTKTKVSPSIIAPNYMASNRLAAPYRPRHFTGFLR